MPCYTRYSWSWSRLLIFKILQRVVISCCGRSLFFFCNTLIRVFFCLALQLSPLPILTTFRSKIVPNRGSVVRQTPRSSRYRNSNSGPIAYRGTHLCNCYSIPSCYLTNCGSPPSTACSAPPPRLLNPTLISGFTSNTTLLCSFFGNRANPRKNTNF